MTDLASKKEQLATQIVERILVAGHEAYFAGGCVRDRLRGQVPKDFDIATSALPEQIQKLFPKTVPVGAQFGVILVIEEGQSFEVATFRTESGYTDGRHPTQVVFGQLEEDAKRRDFTINGLYFDIRNKKVLDYVGGQADINAKIIRSIGDARSRFLEDYLRIFRAIRFSTQLGFSIESNTLTAVKENAKLIGKVSPERIREEFTKLLTSENPEGGIKLLDECGVLNVFLPEMEAMKGVEQPMEFHPEGDVWIHTLMLMAGLKNAPIELAMGCLLHDVAKPATFVRAPDRIRFHGHDTLGAEMARNICKRLTFSNHQTDLICDLVLHHLRFKDARAMRISTLKRFLSLPRFDLHLALHKLDCLASHGHLDAYQYCTEKYEEFLKEPPPPLRLVTGEDLKALGFSPGPEFSKILRVVEDAILEGTVKSKEEGIELVKKRFSPKDQI